MKKTFILSVDGGGTKALISTYILQEIEVVLGKPLPEFDLYTGTSAGSIIATSLAIGKRVDYVSGKFEQLAPAIFPKKHSNNIDIQKLINNWFFKVLFGILPGIALYLSAKSFIKSQCHSSYDKKILYNELKKEFDNLKLRDVWDKNNNRLMIPIAEVDKIAPKMLKTPHHDLLYIDGNTYLADAVTASCSAPTYFDPHKFIIQGDTKDHREYFATDGSLFMTNPSLAGLTEMVQYGENGKNKNYSNIPNTFILSIGNIQCSTQFDKSSNSWGLLSGWKGAAIVESIMELQKVSPHYMTKLILPEDNYIRLEYTSHDSIPLDCDINKYKQQFKEWAREIVNDNKEKIIKFFNQGDINV